MNALVDGELKEFFFLAIHQWYILASRSQNIFLILLWDAYRTFKMFGSFGVAGLKMGRMGENEQALESSIHILE